jgi:uncharacterized protein (DUF1697 family)
MNTFISMLRGINVSGQKKIRMAELRDLYVSLNLVNVETYLQSGNVVFDSTEGDASKLAELIETQIETSFGYAVPVFIRDANDFQRIIDRNPFLNERNEDPAKLYVTFLYNAPSESKLSDLAIPNGEAAEFSIGDKEAFLLCPNGYGRTKLSNSFFERKLDMPATTRNWKTVNALYRVASER